MSNLQSLLNPMSSGPPSPVALVGQRPDSPPSFTFSPNLYPQDETPAPSPSPPPPSPPPPPELPPPRSPSPMETEQAIIAHDTSGTDTDSQRGYSPPRKAPPLQPAPKPAAKKRGIAKPTAAKKATVSAASSSSTTKKPKKPRKTESDELYCICRKPDSGKWMIGCDGCEEWYHGECIHVREEDGNLIDKYICPHCTSPALQTTWKRKCRLSGCRQPADVDASSPSKYCSPAHGEEFFSLQLSRATLETGEIAALVGVARNVAAWKQLGSRIPDGVERADEPFSDEEVRKLQELADEKERLDARARSIERRGQYLGFAVERKKREGGNAVCGYDERFALDDMEWEEFCESEVGKRIFEEGGIEGREGMCVQKRNCKKHMNWHGLLAEEQVVGERIRKERVQALKMEEKKIRERRKRRAVKDEREGVVEVEC